uniref:Uncharacterized protein n=1 Tax=viral metagenome TaxID=1070528 RepID=A0A6H1ZUP6_9ZZZZ
MSLARSIALNIIKSFVPLNLPGTKIISYLTELGVTYRRTEMLADIRTAFDRVKYETQVTALSPDQKVPEAWMNKEDIAAPYTYRVHLKVDYYDPVADSYSTEHRYMFSDDYAAVGDYVEEFPDYAMSKDYVQEKEFTGAQVVGITQNTRGEVPF